MSVTTISALVTSAVFGGGGVATVIHFVRRWTRKVDTFLSDWTGEPARPGVPEKRGVMVRLETIEHEISYNSGSSIKDAVHRIDTNVAQLMQQSGV